MAVPAPGDDRAVMITGAPSGIGAATAREFARRGHQLILVARNAARLRAIAADGLAAGKGRGNSGYRRGRGTARRTGGAV